MEKYFYQLVILIVLAAFYVSVGQTKPESRIISGTPAVSGQLPWQVILKEDEIDTLKCGGSIISTLWVLTAAHCTDGLSSIFLVFGTIELDDNSINMTSTQMFIHPDYNAEYLNNDVSLILLPTPLEFNSFIQPISLVSSTQYSNNFIGTQAIIAGFGVMDDDYLDFSQVLLWAQVQIIDNSFCKAIFTENVVKNTTICAEGVGNTNQSICSGDSGGPLVVKTTSGSFVQIGINSFVAQDRCTEKYPSGYVRLTSFLDYITNTTGLTLS